MKSVMIDIVKWGIILIIGAIAFYMAVPKYQYQHGYKINMVTGKTVRVN